MQVSRARSLISYNQNINKLSQNNPELIHKKSLDRGDVKIKKIESTQEKALELGKELLIGLTPIYGTIHEFQKGNIGWGIFSAITDVFSLVPIVGTGIKAVSASIRAARIAAISQRAVFTAGTKASRLLAAHAIAAASYQGASKLAPDLAKATTRAFDPGVELVYNFTRYGMKDIYLSVRNCISAASKVGKISSTALKNAAEFRRVATDFEYSHSMEKVSHGLSSEASYLQSTSTSKMESLSRLNPKEEKDNLKKEKEIKEKASEEIKEKMSVKGSVSILRKVILNGITKWEVISYPIPKHLSN